MRARDRNTNAYFFLTPFLLVFCAFWIWPILHSLSLSFQNTRIRPSVFDLSANWGRLSIDPAFANALKNSLIIMGVQVPIMIVLVVLLEGFAKVLITLAAFFGELAHVLGWSASAFRRIGEISNCFGSILGWSGSAFRRVGKSF